MMSVIMLGVWHFIIVMLSVIMLSVIILSVVMLNVVMLSVVAPFLIVEQIIEYTFFAAPRHSA